MAVKKIIRLADGDVSISTETEELRAKYVLDASGQQTIVGRHLGTRKNADEPHLKKIGYFSPFEGVQRPTGKREGHPLIAMMDEGWFWMIPLNEKVTSVGMVLDAEVARRVMKDQNIAPDRMLAWGISRCPAVAGRMANAKGSGTNIVAADFSYRCRPYAGEGYFLIGDAAAFMDPIFSTGVSVAINGAIAAVRHVEDIFTGRNSPRARAAYVADLEESTATLFQIIRQYYDHKFRELFMNGAWAAGCA